MLGPDAAEAGWSVTDTVLVVKVAIGVLAGGVLALVVVAAADPKDRPVAAVTPDPARSTWSG